jgi:hypothetical protein
MCSLKEMTSGIPVEFSAALVTFWFAVFSDAAFEFTAHANSKKKMGMAEA